MTRPQDPGPPQADEPAELRRRLGRRIFEGLIGVGLVLAAWAVALFAETLGVAIAHRAYFAGSWETSAVRADVAPFALAAAFPCAVLAYALGRLAQASERAAWARAGTAATLALFAGATAYGVSFGRHLASWAVRAPFIGVLAAIGAVLGYVVVPRLASALRRSPARVAWSLGGGLALAIVAWAADVAILPRLYPAFHTALFVLTIAGTALTAAAFGSRARARPFGVIALIAALVGGARAPATLRRLHGADNVRWLLVEHAPLLGRAVRLAMAVSPPPTDDADPSDVGATLAAKPGEIPRALDWTGRDIVLISIDALRADHVSAYGYPRPTTPAIDALAREGATFDAAYCPTPHTSYSVTSMMTGKYMRPLLALGRGEDSETWASQLRRYGYRTAAFYPPAVFFIDAERFAGFRDRGLDFEYRKVEFADPALRATQLDTYLASGDTNRPLFLWVHLFEPHEPYVAHPEHVFADADAKPRTDIDAYDSEIAAADDGVAAIVARVRARRPGAVIMVTADHGEEFAEHGGRYHGTTVYEEQVRVPLVIVGPGVVPRRVATVVQTIDLLPTVLSALGIPRPPRVRGRDLGVLLAAKKNPGEAGEDPGVAFAETDDYTLLAQGGARLVCARKSASCALYRPAGDPREAKDLAAAEPQVARDLKRAAAAIAREHGRFEPATGGEVPEALRRGMVGDVEAAAEVAALLDDANVRVRRRAAEVSYDLHAPAAEPQLRRAEANADDLETRRFVALALVRAGGAITPFAEALLRDPDRAWRRRAALAFGERGDARAETELAAWWREEAPPRGILAFERAKEILTALATLRARRAVPALVASLDDLRLRPFVADALGAIGDPSARAPLAASFARERYVDARSREARALVALGARAELRAPLARFAGVPEPMPDALALARDAGLLTAEHGGWAGASPVTVVDVTLTVPAASNGARLLVLLADGSAAPAAPAPPAAPALVVRLDGSALAPVLAPGHGAGAATQMADVPGVATATRRALHLEAPGGLLAAWIVARADELPPPPPMPWKPGDDAGARGVSLENSTPP